MPALVMLALFAYSFYYTGCDFVLDDFTLCRCAKERSNVVLQNDVTLTRDLIVPPNAQIHISTAGKDIFFKGHRVAGRNMNSQLILDNDIIISDNKNVADFSFAETTHRGNIKSVFPFNFDVQEIIYDDHGIHLNIADSDVRISEDITLLHSTDRTHWNEVEEIRWDKKEDARYHYSYSYYNPDRGPHHYRFKKEVGYRKYQYSKVLSIHYQDLRTLASFAYLPDANKIEIDPHGKIFPIKFKLVDQNFQLLNSGEITEQNIEEIYLLPEMEGMVYLHISDGVKKQEFSIYVSAIK
jgi:hypothetical protein